MKKTISIIMILMIMTTTVAFAAKDKGEEFIRKPEVAPATESTINGIPESDIVKTLDISGPYFDSYNPTSYQIVNKFKYIGKVVGDNRLGQEPLLIEFSVSRSTSQGSEWTGSASFTAEVKSGIIAKMSATGGYQHKEYRETNEAVGASGKCTVPKQQRVDLEALYLGRASGGTLRTKYFDDNYGWSYMNTPINVKVHPKTLEVEFVVSSPY